MTAPDQALTDLLAAHHRHCVSEEVRLDPQTGVHTYWIECTCVCGADTSVEVTGDREAAVRLADAAHVALVVEQHTNGRHEWPKTTPTGHTYERPTTYVELVRMSGHLVQGEIECWEAAELPPEPVWEMVGIAQQEVERERSRAEKAEATVARVEAEAALLERMIRTAPWSRYTEVRRSHLRSLSAALEREQQ